MGYYLTSMLAVRGGAVMSLVKVAGGNMSLRESTGVVSSTEPGLKKHDVTARNAEWSCDVTQ